MKLIIVRGCPGSGKSTFVKNSFPNLFHLENDMYHYRNGKYCYDVTKMKDAINWVASSCESALKLGMDVVISNTFTRRRFVDFYRLMARDYGAEFIVYRMCGKFNNVHNVPQYVLDDMHNGFEDYPNEKKIYPTENGYVEGD